MGKGRIIRKLEAASLILNKQHQQQEYPLHQQQQVQQLQQDQQLQQVQLINQEQLSYNEIILESEHPVHFNKRKVLLVCDEVSTKQR
ncbi:histone-lysine N-methyltransferase 2D-like [Anoplophora glabripennis]|uniref:histone-lysine N-methyltransferase 2D-like n=1 Tax=Anoplophora glabripennis TaxID=217634 RepID=UPI0008740FB9|nr:histone-lysine N-methyltransferase 2D-like [Anoplophora glabripennis]